VAFRAETPAMHVSSLHPSIPLIQTDTIQPLQYRLETYWCPCLVCYGCGAAIAVLLAACAEKSQNTAQRPQLLHSSGHTRSENNAERPQKMSKKQAEVFSTCCYVQRECEILVEVRLVVRCDQCTNSGVLVFNELCESCRVEVEGQARACINGALS